MEKNHSYKNPSVKQPPLRNKTTPDQLEGKSLPLPPTGPTELIPDAELDVATPPRRSMAVRRVHIGGASITNYREIPFSNSGNVFGFPLRVFLHLRALRNPLIIGYQKTHINYLSTKKNE